MTSTSSNAPTGSGDNNDRQNESVAADKETQDALEQVLNTTVTTTSDFVVPYSETGGSEAEAPAEQPATDSQSSSPADEVVPQTAESSDSKVVDSGAETPAEPAPSMPAASTAEPSGDGSAEASPESKPAPAAAPVVAEQAPPAADTVGGDAGVAPMEAAAAAAAASRIRDRLTGGRPDATPTESAAAGASVQPKNNPSGAVEIPETDELDGVLASQIDDQLREQSGSAAPKPAAPVEEGDAEDAAAVAGDATTEIEVGKRLKGKVQEINGDDVFVDAGLRSSVVVSLRQFPEDKPPEVGAEIEVRVTEIAADGLVRAMIPRARHRAGGNWDALAVGQIVDCTVTGTNKGGLQVSVSNLRGFMPAGQVDLGYVENLEAFVGQKLTAQVTEVNPKRRNLVVSRKALLLAEREGQEEEFWKAVEVGQELAGTVKTLKNYGAFVNIGAVDGFLHIGEISWSRIAHPNEVLKEGQQVQVKVIRIDDEKKRISLGMKQLVQNPWQAASENYAPDSVIDGTVTRIADFGAFVQLEPGIEGMVHISELAWRRVGSVNEVLQQGETRQFKVLDVDPKRKRVSLSVKQLEAAPEDHGGPDDAGGEPHRRRRRESDLRGGMGGNSGGGGLFGDPKDFS